MLLTMRPLVLVRIFIVATVLAGMAWGPARPASAKQENPDDAPTSGHAEVIAQGVATLPVGEVVWRTVRTRANVADQALFEPRPLGFVLATDGPILLTEQASGEQTRLGRGEAAFVREGEMQRRASLASGAVSYLSIELVSVDAAAPPDDAIVLQPGQPFAAPPGLRDLDLVSDTVRGEDIYAVPDSGAKNVVLITAGAANVGRPGGDPVVLIAGEAASFTGELAIGAAPGSGEPAASFVVAMIGPEVPAPPTPAAVAIPAATPGATAATAAPQASGQGEITVEVFTCPPGMSAETLAAAVCAPADEGFELALSGDTLGQPLTTNEATVAGNAVTWSGLPFGDYVLGESRLPPGATTYLLSARNVSGDPEAGYVVTVSGDAASLNLRIYNLSP